MISSLRRQAFLLSNSLLYRADFLHRELTLHNRRPRLHPENLRSKAIFIHIPKTGGYSVAQAIFGRDPWHFRYRDYEKLANLDEFYTFSIVRHPARRLSSMYTYIKNSRIVAPELADCKLAPDFQSFLEEYFFRAKTPTHPFLLGQLDFLENASGEIDVDFLARLETLSADFEAIKNGANMEHVTLPHLNRSSRKYHLTEDNHRFIKSRLAEEYSRLGYD